MSSHDSREETRRPRLAGVLVAASTVLAALVLGTGVLPHRALPDWDEATYLFSGKYLADALAGGRLHDFWYFTQGEREKPFLHSWMLVPIYAAFPERPLAGRALSLALYAGCAILVARLAARVVPERRGTAGAVAAGLFLAAPIVVRHATLAMLEVPGAFLSVLALVVFLEARERGSVRYHVLAGLLVAATFLLKYNYGLLLGLAVALELVSEARREEVGARASLALALAAIVPALVWLSHPFPEKLHALFAFAVNRANVTSVWSGSALTFYPRALLREYHAAPILAAVSAAGLLRLGLRSHGDRGARVLFVYFSTALILMTLHPYHLDRGLFTVAPVLYAGAGGFAGAAAARLGRVGGRALGFVLVALTVLGFLGEAKRAAEEARLRADPGREQALAAVVNAVDPARRNLVLGEFNELSPSLIQLFAFQKSGGPFSLEVGCDVSPEVYDRRGVRAEFHPAICASVSRRIAEVRPDMLIALHLPAGSPYRGEDYATWNIWKAHIPRCLEERPDLAVISSQTFADAVTVQVYRRR